VLDAGFCNYVLITYGQSGLSGGGMARLLEERSRSSCDNRVFGHFGAGADYALAAQRGMHMFGTGPKTWKHIAVGQRKWANLNTEATMYDKKITFEDYYQSDYVVEPFRRLDMCLISDGGRALVVTTAKRARDLKHPPVYIMGLGHHNPSSEIAQSTYMAGPTGAKLAGEQAFSMAGVTLDDIDACQIYDCFTYTVEITLQEYGFFEPGEGEDWFKDGTIEPGGRMPVNTSGGQLSEVYFMGMTPFTEAVMQLMGRCGNRQLGQLTNTKEPQIILCSDNGGILQSHSCCILGRA
jgi:acetyl-CoA acetyltransferase